MRRQLWVNTKALAAPARTQKTFNYRTIHPRSSSGVEEMARATRCLGMCAIRTTVVVRHEDRQLPTSKVILHIRTRQHLAQEFRRLVGIPSSVKRVDVECGGMIVD